MKHEVASWGKELLRNVHYSTSAELDSSWKLTSLIPRNFFILSLKRLWRSLAKTNFLSRFSASEWDLLIRVRRQSNKLTGPPGISKRIFSSLLHGEPHSGISPKLFKCSWIILGKAPSHIRLPGSIGFISLRESRPLGWMSTAGTLGSHDSWPGEKAKPTLWPTPAPKITTSDWLVEQNSSVAWMYPIQPPFD